MIRGMTLTRSGANTISPSSSLLCALLYSDYNCFVGMSQYFSLGFGHTDAMTYGRRKREYKKTSSTNSILKHISQIVNTFCGSQRLFFRTPHVFLNRWFAIEILPRHVVLFFHTIVRHPDADISAFLEEGISKKRKEARMNAGVFEVDFLAKK